MNTNNQHRKPTAEDFLLLPIEEIESRIIYLIKRDIVSSLEFFDHHTIYLFRQQRLRYEYEPDLLDKGTTEAMCRAI